MKTDHEMYQQNDREAMFAPLVLAIETQRPLTQTPPDIDDWMFMETRDIPTFEDGIVRLACYKHYNTRNYVRIDETGQCWMKPTDMNRWVRITNGLAFDQASSLERVG